MRALQEIEDVIGIDATDAILASAKTGEGVDDILEAIVSPHSAAQRRSGSAAAGADHRLVVRQLRRCRDAGAGVDGTLRPKDKIRLMATGRVPMLCEQVGVFTPKSSQREQLSAGEVGFIISGIKELKAAKVGDTVTLARRRFEKLARLQGNQAAVFAGLYPVESNQYEAMREALEKLQAQRRLAAVRTRSVAGAGLRLPLRLPRACCTWTSCRSGSSASSTWISSPPRRRWCTRS
jgi:GTP-binding protein LepA